MDIEQVCEQLGQAVGALARVEVGDLDADGVRSAVQQLRGAHNHVSRLDVALATRASELCGSGTCADPVDLLTGVGEMATGSARRIVRHAELLSHMPVLGAALVVCEVSDDHVAAIAVGRRRIDPAVRPAFDALDAELTDYARHHSPDQLGAHLQYVQRRLERHRNRNLDLRRRRAVRVRKWIDGDGNYQLHGNFDHEMGSRVFTAIDTAVEGLRAHGAPYLVPGADPDDPLAHDREFLAAHALTRLLSHGHVAEHPSTPEVVVLIDEKSLLFGEHAATVSELHDGTRVDVDMVRRLCCEAIVTAVVVSADGKVPLNVGRQARTATRAQRRALRAIYRTCAIEDCTTRFDWCEVHHIWFWELDGLTDLANLVPLCHRHHHLVHDAGWRLTLDAHDRTLTFARPDGTIHSRSRPPGLSPPGMQPAARGRVAVDPGGATTSEGEPAAVGRRRRRTSSTTAA